MSGFFWSAIWIVSAIMVSATRSDAVFLHLLLEPNLTYTTQEAMESFAFPDNLWCLLNNFCQMAHNSNILVAMQNVQSANLDCRQSKASINMKPTAGTAPGIHLSGEVSYRVTRRVILGWRKYCLLCQLFRWTDNSDKLKGVGLSI